MLYTLSGPVATPARRAVVAVAFLIAPVAFAGALESADAVRPMPVLVQTVQTSSSYPITRIYTGETRPRRSSALAFERSGRVVQMFAEEGARVPEGAALARIDNRQTLAQVSRLEAQLGEAEAVMDELIAGPREEEIRQARAAVEEATEQRRLARVNRERSDELFENAVISQQAYDDAVSEGTQTAARLAAAETRLEELLAGTRDERIRAQDHVIRQLRAQREALDVESDRSVLRAPYAGRIAARLLDEGTVVAPGEPLYRLTEDTAPEAWIGIPAHAVDGLTPGDLSEVRVRGKSYPARIKAILPEVDPATRTVQVVFELQETQLRGLEGESAVFRLQEEIAEKGIWLPASALTRGLRGLWNCYVVVPGTESEESSAPGHVIERRLVEVIHPDGDRVFVRGTLEDGDRVVADGTHRVTVGQAVRPVNQLEPTPSL